MNMQFLLDCIVSILCDGSRFFYCHILWHFVSFYTWNGMKFVRDLRKENVLNYQLSHQNFENIYVANGYLHMPLGFGERLSSIYSLFIKSFWHCLYLQLADLGPVHSSDAVLGTAQKVGRGWGVGEWVCVWQRTMVIHSVVLSMTDSESWNNGARTWCHVPALLIWLPLDKVKYVML